MKKKNVILLLAMALSATALSACGSKTASNDEPTTEINFADIAGVDEKETETATATEAETETETETEEETRE
jgi:ABC-type oligopeptide transport system substrate-binding subunit